MYSIVLATHEHVHVYNIILHDLYLGGKTSMSPGVSVLRGSCGNGHGLFGPVPAPHIQRVPDEGIPQVHGPRQL